MATTSMRKIVAAMRRRYMTATGRTKHWWNSSLRTNRARIGSSKTNQRISESANQRIRGRYCLVKKASIGSLLFIPFISFIRLRRPAALDGIHLFDEGAGAGGDGAVVAVGGGAGQAAADADRRRAAGEPVGQVLDGHAAGRHQWRLRRDRREPG